VTGLGLVAAPRVLELVERAPAQEAHAGLAVPDGGLGPQGEEGARETVHDAPVRRHGAEVVEAVADDQLGVRRSLEESGDRGGRVLAVGVDHDHRIGLGPDGTEARSDRLALAAVGGTAEELHLPLACETLELADGVLRGPVVDDDEPPDLAPGLVHELS
jgi:hypothetical protein